MDHQAQKRIAVIPAAANKEDILACYLEKAGEEEGSSLKAFIPRRKMKKRYRGEWNTVTEDLFPGYVFAETGDPEELLRTLQKAPEFSGIRNSGGMGLAMLGPEEEAFIRWIGKGRGDHCIGISTVQIASDTPYKKGDKVNVLSGDLKDFEEEIVGFNFHKRKAMVQTQMFGGRIIHVGIELANSAR